MSDKMISIKPLDQSAKLCYVDVNRGILYFTTDLKNTWGDDWDDAPFEYNAGPPYDTGNYNIYKIMCGDEFDILYANTYFDNSPYSVEQINMGLVPWLKMDGCRNRHIGNDKIYAGATLKDVLSILNRHNIKIYAECEIEDK